MWADRSKERFEMILEPFQAITQLALLSYYPVGSKLTISDNLLFVQGPGWAQPIIRNYNADKKNDLVYLFSVIKRFHSFYNFLNDGTSDEKELFKLLITRSKLGLERLIITYSKTDGDHLTQTMRMYIHLVDHPNTFSGDAPTNTGVNIDDVFIKIVTTYTTDHFNIILSNFRLMEKTPSEYRHFIDSINSTLYPINKILQKWICDNIVF